MSEARVPEHVATLGIALAGLALIAGCWADFPPSRLQSADSATEAGDITVAEAAVDGGADGPGRDSATDGPLTDGPLTDGPLTDGPLTDGPLQGGSHLWSLAFGGSGTSVGYDVAVDGSGNVTVVGAFAGTADLGGGVLSSHAGYYDVLVASFAPDGTARWAQAFGAGPDDWGHGVAVDATGNVTITGRFKDVVSFGGADLTSAGSSDIFIASYTADGAHRWSRRAGGDDADSGLAVAVDGSGNVTVTGRFKGTVNLGGADLTSAGGQDIFIASYSPDGAHRWSRRGGGVGADHSNGAAADGSGNITITGRFAAAVDVGGGTLTTAGDSDLLLASYTADGAHRWSKALGGAGLDAGYAVTVDAAANIVVVGTFSQTVNVGGDDLTAAGGSGIDMLLASFTADGAHRWSRGYGGFHSEVATGIALDAGGNVVVVGSFNGTTNLGGSNMASASSAEEDVFVASYDSGGAFRWSRRFGDVGDDRGVAIASSGSALLITGRFNDTIDFGGGPLTSGSSPGYLAALQP